MYLCTEMESRRITCTGATKRGPGPLDRVIEVVSRVAPLCERGGVTACLEPHLVLHGAEDFEAVFSAVSSPHVGLCLDTGHLWAAGENIFGIIDRFGPWIRSVHIKDHRGTPSVGIGRGEIPIPAVLRRLSGAGCQGFVAVELEVADQENTPRYVREAYANLQRWLGAL
jgi:sugar phosphate isomerase/epimerase